MSQLADQTLNSRLQPKLDHSAPFSSSHPTARHQIELRKPSVPLIDRRRLSGRPERSLACSGNPSSRQHCCRARSARPIDWAPATCGSPSSTNASVIDPRQPENRRSGWRADLAGSRKGCNHRRSARRRQPIWMRAFTNGSDYLPSVNDYSPVKTRSTPSIMPASGSLADSAQRSNDTSLSHAETPSPLVSVLVRH